MFFITSLFLVFSCGEAAKHLGPETPNFQKPLEALQESFLQFNPEGWKENGINRKRSLNLVKRSLNPFEISPETLDSDFWNAFKTLYLIHTFGEKNASYGSVFFQFSDEQRLRLVKALATLDKAKRKGKSQITFERLVEIFRKLRHFESPTGRVETSWYKERNRRFNSLIFSFELAAILLEKGYQIYDIERNFSEFGRDLVEADILVKNIDGSFTWVEVKSHINFKLNRRSETEIFHQLNHLKSYRVQDFLKRNHIRLSKIVIISRETVAKETRGAITDRHEVEIFDLNQILDKSVRF